MSVCLPGLHQGFSGVGDLLDRKETQLSLWPPEFKRIDCENNETVAFEPISVLKPPNTAEDRSQQRGAPKKTSVVGERSTQPIPPCPYCQAATPPAPPTSSVMKVSYFPARAQGRCPHQDSPGLTFGSQPKLLPVALTSGFEINYSFIYL